MWFVVTAKPMDFLRFSGIYHKRKGRPLILMFHFSVSGGGFLSSIPHRLGWKTADCMQMRNNEPAALWRGVTLGAAVLFMKLSNFLWKLATGRVKPQRTSRCCTSWSDVFFLHRWINDFFLFPFKERKTKWKKILFDESKLTLHKWTS